ncbi:hypothetical protein [Armatimonas sp.]|uniref:hypothetical protein n=1 Tax=Armatimonas sp. TaxID=1872638 RepID=UPI003753A9A2
MKYDRNALLEKIQGGELVEVEGRTAHDEAGLDFALAAAGVVPGEPSAPLVPEEAIVPEVPEEPPLDDVPKGKGK